MNTTDEIFQAQADLQTAVGMLRLVIEEPVSVRTERELKYVANRATAALARMHMVLDDLGRPMYHPCTHPEVWDGPS